MSVSEPRPDVKVLLAMAADHPPIHEAPLAEARATMSQIGLMLDSFSVSLAMTRDMACPSTSGEITLRLLDSRVERAPGPAVIYYHGGGFVMGDLESHQSLCIEVARALDLPVIVVGYRLAPEHPWPAAPDDAEAAARWVATSPAELGRSVTGLILAGDSAGGALAIVTAMALRDLPAQVPVIALWPIYPTTDFSSDYPSAELFADGYLLTRSAMHWFSEQYAPDKVDWRASPLLGDQAGMPPTLVVTAELDVLRDEGRAFAAACVEAGVDTVFHEARGTIHGFLTMRQALPSAVHDLDVCFEKLKPMIARASNSA